MTRTIKPLSLAEYTHDVTRNDDDYYDYDVGKHCPI
jgi:hypothetical protein